MVHILVRDGAFFEEALKFDAFSALGSNLPPPSSFTFSLVHILVREYDFDLILVRECAF